MEIVVRGRHGVVVPDHFRQYVADKFTKVERFDHKVIRLDVELAHERNPRQSDHCQRVEVTMRSKGPVVRAEAAGETFYQALELSFNKLEQRLRRAADRRHKKSRGHEVSAAMVADIVARDGWPLKNGTSGQATATVTEEELPEEEAHAPFVVREKLHAAEPMSLEDALHEMELVGHDFYLYADKESGLPSVVYRRKGYDYGVIRLAQ